MKHVDIEIRLTTERPRRPQRRTLDHDNAAINGT